MNDDVDIETDPQMRELFAALEDPPGPFGGAEARRRARPSRSALWGWGAALAASLAVAVLVLPDRGGELRPRAIAPVAPGVSLDALVERGGALVRPDGALRLDDKLLFRLRSDSAGFGCVVETLPDGRDPVRVLPPVGASWPVTAGENLYRLDGQAMGYRTDRGEGRRLYRASVVSAPEDCDGAARGSELEIEWVVAR